MSGPCRITIDMDKCVGSRICVAIAPKVFALNEEGQAGVLAEAGDSPDVIRMAAEGCPVSAITVNEFDEGTS